MKLFIKIGCDEGSADGEITIHHADGTETVLSHDAASCVLDVDAGETVTIGTLVPAEQDDGAL
jgi:hypothetical protein